MGRRSTAKADTPAAGAVSGSGKRLIPRWWSTTVIVVLTVFTLVIGLISAVAGDGLVDLSMFGLAVVSGLVLVSAMSAFVRPRRRREPKVLADGSRVFRAPALTTWPLVAAWIVVLGVAAVWGWVVVTDIGELESPGFSLVMVVGALGSLPDFARLVTGRLHRWTLTVGPDALTYRGYRTDVATSGSATTSGCRDHRALQVRAVVSGAAVSPAALLLGRTGCATPHGAGLVATAGTWPQRARLPRQRPGVRPEVRQDPGARG